MAGASYLGFTQWAIARDAGPLLKAFSTDFTSSAFRSPVYAGESFQLEIFLQWVQMTHALRGSLACSLCGRWSRPSDALRRNLASVPV